MNLKKEELECPRCGNTVKGSRTLIKYRTGYRCTQCGNVFSVNGVV